MPTKQRPRSRAWHRQSRISPEAVALFMRCEELIRLGADDVFRDPPHPRHREFQAAERELMQLLGLNTFTDCSPLERRRPWSPGLVSTWPRARELRKALLAAVGPQRAPPTA